ncbi:unnamed protein product, partial [Protopolystoma xenopodis]
MRRIPTVLWQATPSLLAAVVTPDILSPFNTDPATRTQSKSHSTRLAQLLIFPSTCCTPAPAKCCPPLSGQFPQLRMTNVCQTDQSAFSCSTVSPSVSRLWSFADSPKRLTVAPQEHTLFFPFLPSTPPPRPHPRARLVPQLAQAHDINPSPGRPSRCRDLCWPGLESRM